uniref:Uncharacterized protein n=1 Tax=Zea mays TaxID=4577 RepID=A0A804QSG6_MAIZE
MPHREQREKKREQGRCCAGLDGHGERRGRRKGSQLGRRRAPKELLLLRARSRGRRSCRHAWRGRAREENLGAGRWRRHGCWLEEDEGKEGCTPMEEGRTCSSPTPLEPRRGRAPWGALCPAASAMGEACCRGDGRLEQRGERNSSAPRKGAGSARVGCSAAQASSVPWEEGSRAPCALGKKALRVGEKAREKKMAAKESEGWE